MSQTLKLTSVDNQSFEVQREVMKMSEYVTNMLEDIEDGEACPTVPVNTVRGEILSKVLEYCKYHTEAEGEGEGKKSDVDIKAWDVEFVKVDQSTLFELILAANYMNIKSLLDLACLSVANMIKGKSPDEIRKTFGIKNDFSPEEEAEVRKENQWAFE